MIEPTLFQIVAPGTGSSLFKTHRIQLLPRTNGFMFSPGEIVRELAPKIRSSKPPKKDRQTLVQPIVFGVSLFQFQISIDNLFSRSLLLRSVEKRPERLRLEIEIK